MRLFISSVQKEFAEERAALRDFLRGDALLRRFFEAFLFEEVPAADRRADDVYLDEVERCDVYLGLFGNEYGFEDAQGIAPTQREFELATRRHKHRFIFVKGADDKQKHPKMRALIRQAGNELIRRRFVSAAELIGAVYAALVQYLEDRELIRTGPFDAAPCPKATLADLDPERIAWFLREARRARGFPLPEEATPQELLTHLNLLNDGRPSHAAVLLFGKQPQRFLISSEVKCAHFHGTEVAKPIPSYQVYKGTVFALVDQAVDFVMSKINLRVSTRAAGPQAPVAYEIPREVVAEAIVNAVAHRDYTSKGSVQVMLFADRLEVWNPGALPLSLTLEMLREAHGSVPGNPLLAEPLYLTKYIERMGTGTRDMIRRCREIGLPEPEFSVKDGFVTTIRRSGAVGPQPESRPESQPESRPESLELRVLRLLGNGPLSKAKVSAGLGHKEISGQLNKTIRLLLADQNVELTIPDKPNSRLQKYRLTEKGLAMLATLRKVKSAP
jgi:ATP-dependent DNA helicase RecG